MKDGFSTQIHIRQNDIGQFGKSGQDAVQKIGHISDLYSTNCTQEIKKGRTKKWKTLWKVWNSTGKTGFKAGLLNFLHRVFNMWKNNRSSTDCIPRFCGKLFSPAKQRDIYPAAG